MKTLSENSLSWGNSTTTRLWSMPLLSLVGRGILVLIMLLVLGKQATAEESAQVISISVNGIASAQTLTVQLLRRGDRDARSEKLTVGSSLDAGTEISVPVGAQITLRSINGNELVVRGGTRVRLSRIGKTGEKYHIENGDISFKVVNALSFLR